jgi:hypothetical protein
VVYASSVLHRSVLVGCLYRLYTSGIEVLAVLLHGARRNVLVVILNWLETANNANFDDLDDLLKQTSTFGCPVIIMGDINIHIEVISNPHSVGFQMMFEATVYFRTCR